MSYNTPPSSGQTYRTSNTSMTSGAHSPGYQSSSKYVQSQLNPSANRSNGHKPTSSMDLAQQYETDMVNIRRSVFKDVDNKGHKIESYISHVRIIEDSKSPNSRPPANSPQSNKKNRFLILSIKTSGRMRLHKAKESSSGIQIGRSWDFDELTGLELDDEAPTGFICQMGKYYYWEVHTPKERRVWCTTLLENYIKYTNGNIPKLVNCSLEYFHLEGLQQSLEIKQKSSSLTTPMLPASPITQQSKSFTNPLRSPSKSASPDLTSLKKDLATSPLSNAAAFVTKSPTAAAATAAAAAKLMGSTSNSIQPDYVSEVEIRKNDELRKQKELEDKRKLELQKRKQQELERRKKEELERRRNEELERRKQETADAEKKAQIIAKDATNLGTAQQITSLQLDLEPPILSLAKRGQPSQALSEAPSQMSFEYGDENHYHRVNQSVESHNSDMTDLNNYIDGYASGNEEETAPLNLSIPKLRHPENTGDIVFKKPKVPTITTPLDQQSDQDSLKAVEEEINKLITSPESLNVNETTLTVSSNRKASRARAFSRVENNDELNDNEIYELLEEIGYDPLTDDSHSLEKKVLKELEKLQYDKIQTLTEVNDVKSILNRSLQMAFNCCNHIDPILSLLSVELSTFKEDVEFIESQGKGLQVGTTNEKLLMNELNEIVHSVEISDRKLSRLINADVDLTLANSELESLLLELYNALRKINDVNNNDNDTEYHLSKMKALQEKRKIFEGAKNKFITNFKTKAAILFKSVCTSLSSKLALIDSNSFDETFLKTCFIDKATSLMTLCGLISFVKSVSPTDYNDIMDSFISSFDQVLENITTVLLKNFNEEVSKDTVNTFSFIANPVDLFDYSYSLKKPKELSSRKNSPLFSSNNEQKNTPSDQITMAKSIDRHCSELVKLVTLQQELMKNLFGLSSSQESQFSVMVKTELKSRCEKFKDTNDFLNTPIESDREISDQIYEVMRNLFDPVFTSFFKTIVTLSRDRIIDIPAIICTIKSYSGLLAPTCHEFCYNSFTKFEDKMNLIWAKEIDIAIQNINSFKIHCQVVNYVKAYPIFYLKIESVISSLEYVNIEAFGSSQKNYGNYYMLWASIKSALSRNSDLLKLEIPLREQESEDIDIDINISIQKHLTLWINYKWAFEESKSLPEFPKDLLKSIDDARDQELTLFSESFGRQYSIGNIMRLVEDMEDLTKNNENPVNFATYSIENIKSLMLAFKGDSLKQEIANIASELKSLIKGRCYNENKPEFENELSISIAQSIEKDIYNNGMHAMCQLFISTFNKLSMIIEKYYTNFDIPVDKYIINFNFKKHYI
ncbi:hypothetical protein CANINC_000556 [Pichia inconspicua]|uniref:Exocyst complex component Sec3 PIP2-binding N-terminal domain-containing protein n=1 Tax=Pichia inconspicua TaxID=52247 RepID=A0A4T0X709_9ASCO|nr:hypothetical protein CANINC_000556 [[Candida] inconspicua]